MSASDIRGRLILIGIVILTSLYFLLGTFRFLGFAVSTPVPPAEDKVALADYTADRNELLRRSIRFGLDLMGGVDVLLSIDEDQIARTQLDELRRLVNRAFRDIPIPATTPLDRGALAVNVTLTDPTLAREALNILRRNDIASVVEPFDGEAFLRSGRVTLKLRTESARREALEALERTRDLLRERVDSLGLVQPSVAIQGTSGIRIQLPGETDPEGTVAEVVRPAFLDFRLVHPNYPPGTQITDSLRREIANDPQWVIRPYRQGREDRTGKITYDEGELVVSAEPSITGSDIANAYVQPAPPATYHIGLEFRRLGIEKMARVTTDNPGRHLAILLDDVVRSFPTINDPILNGRASITGSFTLIEASQLAKVISTGALPVRLRTESSRVIGAKLGADSIAASMRALAYGGVVIAIFMVAYYAGSGLVAIGALLVNVVVILALLASWGATLTLSGIGGILLTLGMAVDANILIYERIREELRAGKRAVEAINAGFDNAFSTIIDANLTTLITALILLQFGEGSVQGFALTMTFGIFATLFTGLYVTRTFFATFFEARNKAPMGKASILQDTAWDFIGKRRFGYALSILLLLFGVGEITLVGLRVGADFAGGVIAEVEFARPEDLTTQSVSRALREAEPGLGTVDVVNVVNANSFLIKTKLVDDSIEAVDNTSALLVSALEKSYGDAGYTVLGRDEIGREVSGSFVNQAFTAFLFASLGVLLYVAFRFEFWFGVAAVLALIHDILITLGVLTLLNVEMTLEVVAALLVVLGYSINDTIVIFDRIREQLTTHLREDFKTLVNRSINQSLSRTIITSATTILVILCMILFGGQGLHDFSLALLIGIITGTYSSSFIASPLLVYFAERKQGQLIAAKEAA